VVPLVLLVGAGELTGGDDCGWVGVLALGQPASSTQREAMPHSECQPVLLKVKRFDKVFRLYRLPGLETRPEGGFAQLPH
jgi:hypothetical protein